MTEPRLSIVVVSYNMERELPRTLRSLSTTMQRDIDAGEYEVIVVDNGSTSSPDVSALLRIGNNISFHRLANASASPVPAINYGLSRAKGRLVGVMIDGARMVSPRMLATALEAAELSPRPLIGTLAFHLGPDVQMKSVADGYCQEVEDQLLSSVDWESDGYELFSISTFAGSSSDGWFVVPAESNAVFLTREQWTELGGYDPSFVSPGGGLANLDVWARACARTDWRLILLLGEATFHQFHGGIATNSSESKWDRFHEEYVRVRGTDYRRPNRKPLMVGQLHPSVLPSVRAATIRAIELEGQRRNDE